MRVPGPRAEVSPVDAFDLPEWLGERPVVWRSDDPLGEPLVPGELRAEGGGERMACDLLACDRAHPEPVLPEQWRREAHVQWAMGQVLLVDLGGRLTLVCPGVDVEVDSGLESLRRLAKAVGAPTSHVSVTLRL